MSDKVAIFVVRHFKTNFPVNELYANVKMTANENKSKLS